MKSPVVVVFVSAMLALASPGPLCADSGKHPYPPEIQRIKDRGVLLVGMYAKDVKPFIFRDKAGALVGHDVEMARQIADALGVKVQIDRSATSFNGLIDLVAGNKVDIGISLISRTLARAQKVLFSDPYIVLRPTLLMNRLTVSRYRVDLTDPLRSLGPAHIRAAEQKGNSYVGFAKTILPNAEIREYGDWDQVMAAVLHGDVDVAFRDEIGVRNYIAGVPEASIQMQMFTLDDDKYADSLAIALPPESSHLRLWLNLFLDQRGGAENADTLLKQYAQYYE